MLRNGKRAERILGYGRKRQANRNTLSVFKNRRIVMRLGMISLLAGIIFLMAGAPARAQYSQYYGREKWEVTPFAGYETSGSYPLTSSTVTVNDLRKSAGKTRWFRIRQ